MSEPGISKVVSRILNSKIADNFFHLTLLQGLSFIIPIITIPYLASKLGYEKIGLVYFAQSFMVYLSAIPEYGFNLTATQEVSISRTDNDRLSVILSNVFTTKLVLVFVAFILLVFSVFMVDRFHEESCLFYGSFLIVVGQSFQPTFFFQGIEQMRYIAYISLLSKALFCILIFFYIRKETDYIYVNVVVGIGNVIFTMIALLIVRFKYGIRLMLVSYKNVHRQLSEGLSIFISSFSVVAYMNSNLFILGLFASKYELGIYSLAEKLFLVVRQILAIFSQAIYPRVCLLAEESIAAVVRFFRSSFPVFFGLICVLQTIVFAFSDRVVHLFSHSPNPEMAKLIRLSVFIPLIVSLNIPAYQLLIAKRHVRYYSGILIVGGIISVVSNLILSQILSYKGTVIAIYITETFITIALWYYIFKFKYLNNPFFR